SAREFRFRKIQKLGVVACARLLRLLILAMRSSPRLRTELVCWRDRANAGPVPGRVLFGGVAVTVFLFYCHSWLRRQMQETFGKAERLSEVVIKKSGPVMNGCDQ